MFFLNIVSKLESVSVTFYSAAFYFPNKVFVSYFFRQAAIQTEMRGLRPTASRTRSWLIMRRQSLPARHVIERHFPELNCLLTCAFLRFSNSLVDLG